MDGSAERSALDRTVRALQNCYELARASGYRQGSPAMQALERAERDFRRARERWRAALEAAAAPSAGQPDELVVDLREHQSSGAVRTDSTGGLHLLRGAAEQRRDG